MKHVLLEGPDGAGKSTMAQTLVADFGYAYVHNGLYPKNTGAELLDIYTTQLLDETPAVIDRSFVSELVYGRVMRGEDRLGPIGYTVMTRLARARGITECICLPKWETVMSNWLHKRKDKFDPVNRKGDYVDAVGKLGKIYDIYEGLADQQHYMRFNYQTQKLNGFTWRSKGPRSLPSTMTGSPTARFLVVGEQINLKDNPDWDIPFHSIKGSSRYLTTALHLAGYEEYDLAFCNAYNRLCAENHLASYTTSLPQFKTAIAVGKVAMESCLEQGIPFVAVPHPSYWKRFKSSRMKDYVEQLRRIHESPVRHLLRCVAEVA